MIKIFILALKNIFRNKRRTLLTFFAIIVGIVALIICGGFIEFSYWGLRETTIRSQLGHLQIYKKGYSENYLSQPYRYMLNNYKELKQKIEELPYVETVTLQLTTSGLISSGERTLNCLIKGVEPEADSKLSSFEGIVEGNDLSSAKEEPCIIIGSELRKGLNIKIEDYLTLITTTVDGAVNAVDVKFIGVCSSGSKEYDSVIVKMPIKILQKLLNIDSVEKLVVVLDKTENTDIAKLEIEKLAKKECFDIEIKKWNELATYYNAVVRLYNSIFNVIKFIIAAIVFFSIANTMVMSIFERFREIGTIRAMGTKKSLVVFMFLSEGFWTGLIGGALGVLAGILTANIINFSGGIYIPPPPGMSTGYTALILVSGKVILYSYISTLLIAIISTLYPAIRAANLKIVDALGHI